MDTMAHKPSKKVSLLRFSGPLATFLHRGEGEVLLHPHTRLATSQVTSSTVVIVLARWLILAQLAAFSIKSGGLLLLRNEIVDESKEGWRVVWAFLLQRFAM